MEEIRRGAKCKECKGKMKPSKVITRCRDCESWYHNGCSGATRRTIESEASRGNWRCKSCEVSIQREEGEARETEEEVRKAGDGGKEDWAKIGKDHIRILQWNADGITGKRGELEECLDRWDVDVVVIQETKLSSKSVTPTLRGYTAVRKDRVVTRKGEEMKGGGLLTYIKRCIPFKRLQGWKGGSMEGLRVVIDGSRRQRYTITNVYMYRPPIRRIQGEDERSVKLRSGSEEDPTS